MPRGTPRVAAISVDLDEVPCYAAIHGIEVPEGARHAIYRRALPRFAELFAEEPYKQELIAGLRRAPVALRQRGEKLAPPARILLRVQRDLVQLPVVDQLEAHPVAEAERFGLGPFKGHQLGAHVHAGLEEAARGLGSVMHLPVSCDQHKGVL